MHDHAESRVGQEGAAGSSCFCIATINRDDGFEIAEGLSLQAIKTLCDEIGALINGQSDGDARSGQIAISFVQLVGAIRSAQISAKYGAMVSFPGSTEWKRPSVVTPISYRRCNSLAGS